MQSFLYTRFLVLMSAPARKENGLERESSTGRFPLQNPQLLLEGFLGFSTRHRKARVAYLIPLVCDRGAGPKEARLRLD